ncbi:MAG: hypothetical protein N3F66_05830 [Spirochaetes bacterium]|nr:hypothetical protein [Spirochaetota bacterium]
MKNIRIEIDDRNYEHILFLLRNLKIRGLKVIEEDKNKMNKLTKKTLKKLLTSKKVEVFQSIDDPLQWQRNQRDQWL